MIAPALSFRVDLEKLYDSATHDPSFREVLALAQGEADDDDMLADLIEADGRMRLRIGRPVELARYLDAVPDLASRTEPLDAGIDMTLRALAQTGKADAHSIDSLIAEYPHLESLIRESAALNNALWSTTGIHERLATCPGKSLPCEFGPRTEGGAPRYELTELLGEGAFGQVYLAVDRQLSEDDHQALVSIKVIPGGDRTPWGRQRIVDEATKARRINHVNVVRVIDLGVSEENEDFIVYEYVEGGDLGRRVRRGRPLVAREASRLVAKIARGVHAAHMAGVVHCDLKPNNIVLTEEGEPKVADFGIAVRAGDSKSDAAGRADDSEPLGNLAFMSPEQYRTEPGALTIPSDVYALGGILFWLLSGDLPNGSTPEEIRRTHVGADGRGGPPHLTRRSLGSDRDLESICRRALAVCPERRYDSAAGFADDLEAWLDRRAIPWTQPSLLRRLGLWARRKPGLAIASFIILLMLIVGGVVLQHYATVAHEKKLEAQFAKDLAASEKQIRAEAGAVHTKFLERLRGFRDEGIVNELLPQIWFLEWLFGPTVLGYDDQRLELWRLRVDTVAALLEKAKREGRAHHFEAIQWESAYGFWLLRDGQDAKSEAVLEENLAKLRGLLREDDPWLGQIDALKTCARVGRVVAGDPGVPADRDSLVALADALESIEPDLNETFAGSPLHRIVLERLIALHGDDHLGEAARREALEARHAEVIE